MGYVILITVAVVFVVVLTLALAKAAADLGGNAEEERWKDDEAQIEYLKEWNRKQREKKKRS